MKDDFSFLEKYITSEKNKDFISILIKNQYGDYSFEPLDIKVPNIDLKLNYGKKFPEIFKKTVSKLKNNNKGLYMFHGDPGTGKSSFIKYLTTVIDKEFIFIPSNFIDKFISDPDIFSILLRRKKSVIILEDAEKILISRETDDNQFISTLLNLSDGILSDMLEVSVILTYNCDETKIDKALKRKGRTMVDYRFGKLSVEESKLLAESLNFTEEQVKDIKEPMSLSEIYNMNDENKFYEDESNKKRVIGFGN
jgi:ATP-dependent 26S proteasome regulatory subunit